jgi:hypothetical protein
MTDKIEFPGVIIDASEPVRMDWERNTLDTRGDFTPNVTPIDWERIQPDPSMGLKIGQPEYTSTVQFHSQDQGKCVMRLSKDGTWVDPDLTTDEAAKAVIAALDLHIKHVVAERDAVLRQALEAFDAVAGKGKLCDAAVAAIKEILK